MHNPIPTSPTRGFPISHVSEFLSNPTFFFLLRLWLFPDRMAESFFFSWLWQESTGPSKIATEDDTNKAKLETKLFPINI